MFPPCKGQTEKDLSDLDFSRVTIIRPGVLELEQKRAGPMRHAESTFLIGTVAKALIAAATDPSKWHGADKVCIFDNKS
ncbi:hypothetical protein GGF32_008928 [Allomyces javanicus]|nr:hypothetical protein GGF32_008928 [Allomyces javanicus]